MTTPSLSPDRPRPVRVPVADDAQRGPAPPWLDPAPGPRALIMLHVAVFLVQAVLSGGKSIMHFSSDDGLAFGASYSLSTLGENRWETLVTACFLHGDLFHIGFNMLALWQAGPLVERAVGSASLAPMYLLAGVAGNALSVAYGWYERTERITVGASGAISGVLAAAIVASGRAQGWRSPLTRAIARWLAWVLAFGFFANLGGANIANSAHVGGAIVGGAIAASWRRGRMPSRGATTVTIALCVGVLVACIAVVGWHDHTDPFASKDLGERLEFTRKSLHEGRCVDAMEGQRAVDRIAANTPRAAYSRNRVLADCGAPNGLSPGGRPGEQLF